MSHKKRYIGKLIQKQKLLLTIRTCGVIIAQIKVRYTTMFDLFFGKMNSQHGQWLSELPA